MRALTAILAVLIIFSVPDSKAAAQADGDVTIRVSYAFQLNRLRPNPRNGITTRADFTVVLSGQNTVTERWESRSGRSARRSSTTRVLGDAGQGRMRWKVVSSNELRRIVDYPQNQTIFDIRVSGRSCRASVRYVLKPGFKEYVLPRMVTRELAYFGSIRVISSSCQIQ